MTDNKHNDPSGLRHDFRGLTPAEYNRLSDFTNATTSQVVVDLFTPLPAKLGLANIPEALQRLAQAAEDYCIAEDFCPNCCQEMILTMMAGSMLLTISGIYGPQLGLAVQGFSVQGKDKIPQFEKGDALPHDAKPLTTTKREQHGRN